MHSPLPLRSTNPPTIQMKGFDVREYSSTWREQRENYIWIITYNIQRRTKGKENVGIKKSGHEKFYTFNI